MASKTAFLIAAAALSGCAYKPGPVPEAGVAAINVPVVSRAEFAFDVAAPNGLVSSSESARLDAWFRSLDLRYGDAVYVDGAYAGPARDQIAAIAGNYGMLVANGAPVTSGVVPPGAIRVVVTRAVASVPNCPNWEEKSQPNYNNKIMPNFGCGVNSALALMVANPEDLVHGREGSGVGDAAAAAKAVTMYRNWPLTGIVPGQSLRPLLTTSTTKKAD